MNNSTNASRGSRSALGSPLGTLENSAMGFAPTPSDYEPPTTQPAPAPTTADLDPWDFLEAREPIDIESEHGAGIMALHLAQMTWAMGVLKERIERLEDERRT